MATIEATRQIPKFNLKTTRPFTATDYSSFSLDTRTSVGMTQHEAMTKGSEAFRLVYSSSISERALYHDIVSYLGEYRFQIPEYRFIQFYSKTDWDPQMRLRDGDQGRSLIGIGKKAIEDKKKEGEPTGKVEADLKGIQKIEAFLIDAKDGDRIVYATPPDPEYGFEYGFIYDSRVEEIAGGEKRLHIRALRIDGITDLREFNKAISQISGIEQYFVTPNEFIENPVHIKYELTNIDINRVLHQVFQFEPDRNYQEAFSGIIRQMEPYIQHFIAMVRSNEPVDQLEKAFHALENYALELKKGNKYITEHVVFLANRRKEPVAFDYFIGRYGYEPPKVRGSCGSSGGRNSNNIYGMGSIFSSGKGSSEAIYNAASGEMKCVTCPFCKAIVDAIVTYTTIKCPSCQVSITK